jgi:hypothetical protein
VSDDEGQPYTPTLPPEEREAVRREWLEARREQRPQTRDAGAPANRSASPVARGDGWRGPSAYRRPAEGAKRPPAGEQEGFFEDSLEDVGR